MARRKKPKLKLGDVVSERYRIDGVVGHGGFGTVYKAAPLAGGEHVALKVLHAKLKANQTDARRFQREASLVKKLTHEHVVRMLDFGQTDDDCPFIAFELLEGRALNRVLRKHGPLTPGQVASISRSVLEGLGAAHELGIIHRDIKPANIFLCEGKDAASVAKVLDFGVAKALAGEESMQTELTKDGQMIGTPNYMAPEQVRTADIGPHTDLYAFGLVMAEMLTAERVVAGKSPIKVYMKHLSKVPIELPAAVQASTFGALISRAIAKPLEQRWATARDVLTNLEHLVANHPELAIQAALPGAKEDGAVAEGDDAATVATKDPDESEVPTSAVTWPDATPTGSALADRPALAVAGPGPQAKGPDADPDGLDTTHAMPLWPDPRVVQPNGVMVKEADPTRRAPFGTILMEEVDDDEPHPWLRGAGPVADEATMETDIADEATAAVGDDDDDEDAGGADIYDEATTDATPFDTAGPAGSPPNTVPGLGQPAPPAGAPLAAAAAGAPAGVTPAPQAALAPASAAPFSAVAGPAGVASSHAPASMVQAPAPSHAAPSVASLPGPAQPHSAAASSAMMSQPGAAYGGPDYSADDQHIAGLPRRSPLAVFGLLLLVLIVVAGAAVALARLMGWWG